MPHESTFRRLLAAAGVRLEDRDQALDLATLPDHLQRALAPRLREVGATPTPPPEQRSDLAELIAVCADTPTPDICLIRGRMSDS